MAPITIPPIIQAFISSSLSACPPSSQLVRRWRRGRQLKPSRVRRAWPSWRTSRRGGAAFAAARLSHGPEGLIEPVERFPGQGAAVLGRGRALARALLYLLGVR